MEDSQNRSKNLNGQGADFASRVTSEGNTCEFLKGDTTEPSENLLKPSAKNILKRSAQSMMISHYTKAFQGTAPQSAKNIEQALKEELKGALTDQPKPINVVSALLKDDSLQDSSSDQPFEFDSFADHSKDEYQLAIEQARINAMKKHEQIQESDYQFKDASKSKDRKQDLFANAKALADLAIKDGIDKRIIAKDDGQDSTRQNQGLTNAYMSTRAHDPALSQGTSELQSGTEANNEAQGAWQAEADANKAFSARNEALAQNIAKGFIPYHGGRSAQYAMISSQSWNGMIASQGFKGDRVPFAYIKTSVETIVPKDRFFVDEQAGKTRAAFVSDGQSNVINKTEINDHKAQEVVGVAGSHSAYDDVFGGDNNHLPTEHHNERLDPSKIATPVDPLAVLYEVKRSELESDINESSVRHDDPNYWATGGIEAHEESTLPAYAFASDGPEDSVNLDQNSGHITVLSVPKRHDNDQKALDQIKLDNTKANHTASSYNALSQGQGTSLAFGQEQGLGISSVQSEGMGHEQGQSMASGLGQSAGPVEGYGLALDGSEAHGELGSTTNLDMGLVGTDYEVHTNDPQVDASSKERLGVQGLVSHKVVDNSMAHNRGGYMPCYFIYDNCGDRYLLDEGSCRLIGITYTGDWIPSSYINDQLSLIDEDQLFSVFFNPAEGNKILSHVKIKQGPHSGERLYISGTVIQRDDTGIAMLVSGYFTQVKSKFMECLCKFMNHSSSFDIDTFTGEVQFGYAYNLMLGLEETDRMPRTVKEFEENFIHPEDLMVYRKQNDVIYNPSLGDYYESIYRIKHRGGYYIWCIDRGLVIERKGSGVASRIIGTTTNIDVVRSNFERLKRSIYQDPLTGLHNRFYLNTRYKYFTMEESQPLSLVYVDISGLKVINDYLGHTKGDELVKLSAQILSNDIYLDHEVVRLSGDEFLLIFTNCSDVQCKAFITKFANTLDERNRNHEFPLPIYFGFGIATLNEIDDGDTFLRCEARADVRLQEYKTAHRTSIYTELQAFIEAALGQKVVFSDNRRLEYLDKEENDEPDVVPTNQLNAQDLKERHDAQQAAIAMAGTDSHAMANTQAQGQPQGLALGEGSGQGLPDTLDKIGTESALMGMGESSLALGATKASYEEQNDSYEPKLDSKLDAKSDTNLSSNQDSAQHDNDGFSKGVDIVPSYGSSGVVRPYQGSPYGVKFQSVHPSLISKATKVEEAIVKAHEHDNKSAFNEKSALAAASRIQYQPSTGKAEASAAVFIAAQRQARVIDIAMELTAAQQQIDARNDAHDRLNNLEQGKGSKLIKHSAFEINYNEGKGSYGSGDIYNIAKSSIPQELISDNSITLSWEQANHNRMNPNNWITPEQERRLILAAEQAAMDDMKYTQNSVTIPDDLSAGFGSLEVEASDLNQESKILDKAHQSAKQARIQDKNELDNGPMLGNNATLEVGEQVTKHEAQSALQEAQAFLNNLPAHPKPKPQPWPR